MYKKKLQRIVLIISTAALCLPLVQSRAQAAPADSGLVTAQHLHLRSAPNDGSGILGSLSQNSNIRITNELPNGWMSVQTDAGAGYVSGLYVQQLGAWQEKSDAVIRLGKSYWGVPYVFGAERFQTDNFDCSSFVQYLYSEAGIDLGWNSREQAAQGEWIPFSEMRRGDLVFFFDEDYPNETGLNKVRHVGIYMGDGKILHTYQEGIGVTVSDLYQDALEGDYWYQNFLFAKRVLR